MDFKSIFNNIINFFVDLYYNHFAVIIIFIVLLVVIILFAMHNILQKKHREKVDDETANKQAIASLTTEEIENISKNVSNPDEFREMVETETSNTNAVEETVEENQASQTDDSVKTEKEKVEKNPTPSKKSTSKKPVEKIEEPAPTKRIYTGKWKIKQDGNGFYAKLHASNGGLLLKTECYTTMSGVKSGIETIKKNVENGNFAISIDKHNHYHFKLFSKSNKLICVSEDYSSKAKCDNGITSVKRFANSATIIFEENDN